MKKLMIITIMTFLVGTAYTQSENRTDNRQEIKDYIEESIIPFMIGQQNLYMSAITDEDKETVNKIKDRMGNEMRERDSYDQKRGHGGMNSGKERGKQSRSKGDRKTHQDHRNKKQQKAMEQLEKITSNYPDLNKEYSKLIEGKIMIWKDQISELSGNKNKGLKADKNEKSRFKNMFDILSTPEGLLLWSPDRMKTKFAHNRTNHGFRGKQNHANPELRAEISEYINAEILPIVVDERKLFNKNLSERDIAMIDEARQKIEVRQVMFKSWYESEDFEPGKRAKDSNFDSMREDMRSSMLKVKGISQIYHKEIKEIRDNIMENNDKWEKDIESIALSYNANSDKTINRFENVLRNEISPIKFMLLDPENPKPFGSRFSFRVFIYPNPFEKEATLALVGAKDKDVNVELINENGKVVKNLFSGTVNDNRFEVTLSRNDMANDVSLVQITTGDIKIKRRISLDS